MSPAGSDVVLLWTWRACLILAAAALVVALGLALKRALEERGRARKQVRRREVERLAQALIASPLALEASRIPPLAPGDEAALLSVSLDILRVTRGRDAERMLMLLKTWNLKPYLEKLLAGGKRSRQIRALTLLSRFQDASSLELLLRHLEDPAIYVQLAALRGVAERGEPAHLPRVVRALSRSRQTNVPMLADILRRFGKEAVPALADLAETAETLEVRLAAVTALGGIGALEAFEPLARLAAAREPALRIRALDALAQVGDPRAEATVAEALGDPDPRLRAAAARAAGLLGLRGTIPALATVLEDAAWEVRYRAADSLYALGPTGIAVLRAMSEGATPGGEMSMELLAEKEGIAA